MFEFHGWINVEIDDHDDANTRVLDRRMDTAVDQLAREVDCTRDTISSLEIVRAGNAMVCLSVHGLRNHRYEPIIDLFRWVAQSLPHSYGLLYINDTEQVDGNNYRVFRVAREAFSEHADPFLSPRVPTVEEPFE